LNLEERISDGISGKYSGLANGFQRLNEVIFGIQRSTYYLLGGQSGTFKTTLCDFMILNAITDALKKGIKLNVFYYSYEIDRITKQCNWLSVIAYQKYGVIIPSETIKGLGEFRLTKEQHKIIQDCIPDVELLFSRINFEFVPSNPTGIFNQCFKFFETIGTVEREKYIDHERKEKYKIVKYIPNDPNEITIGVLDHLYCLKKERGFAVKETIDKHSEYCVQLRNLFGMSWLNIQQFNRAMSSIDRIKFKGADMSPQESDFKDTGNTYQDERQKCYILAC
jgi:hypothetical protein